MGSNNLEEDAPSERNGIEKPYISKHLPVHFKNILQVIEDELSQPQVMGVSLTKHSGLGDNRILIEPSLTVTFEAQKRGSIKDFFSEFDIAIDKQNYDEAIRFIIKNSSLFEKKYSVKFVSYLGKPIENIPVHMYRDDDYMESSDAHRVPVSNKPLFQGVNEFCGLQMDNPDVSSVAIESASVPHEKIVTVTLASGATVEFLIAD